MLFPIRSFLSVALLAFALFFGIARAEMEDQRKYLIDPATTAINGITITTTEREIIRRFGKPKSVKKGYSEVENKPSKDLNYDGMKIYVIDGAIYNFSCTSKRCRTNRGVQVGDSKAKVIEIYGPGNPPYEGSENDTLSYPLKGIDSYLFFLFRDGKVAEIEFFVDFV
jgi:hypothetical protein